MNIKSINPHDQSVIGETPISSAEEIENTVKKAREALNGWKNTPIEERCKYVTKFGELLKENGEELAKLISMEMGKPLAQARDDVKFELDFVNYYADNGPKFLADEKVWGDPKNDFRMTFEPYGVVACICPWNFPISMVTSGMLPALVAGNTVVVKPSEYTTLTQKRVVELMQETGIPAGVVDYVIGAGDVGATLLQQKIDLVWFTGSTRAGQQIFKVAAEKFIKSLLEMGGSSPGIVFADADLDNAIENLYWARFLNAGQVCTAVKRLLVERKIFDKFVALFKERVEKIKVGNPLDESDMGPLVNKKQLDLLVEQVEDAKSKGVKIVCGGNKIVKTGLENGNYFEPTLMTGVTPEMRVFSEEIFGPVLPIIPFDSEEEVIKLANQTEYGLSAEVYTTDLEKAERVGKQIECGVVGINTDNYFKPECPFGGYKKSGVGREYGRVGMQEFAQIKVLAVQK